MQIDNEGGGDVTWKGYSAKGDIGWQGEGGGSKNPNFGVTSFMDGPLRTLPKYVSK